MPLQKAPIALQFAGGLETKQDSKQVPLARLLDLQNCTFTKQTTLAKRSGYRSLGSRIETTLAQLTNPKGVGLRGSELVQFANDRAYSYLDVTDRWSDAGPVSSVVATSQPIARTGNKQSMPDVATNSGITVAAWEDSAGGVWATVLDAASLRVITAPTQLDSAGVKPRCVPVGNNLAVLFARPDLGQIWVTIINPAAPAAALTPQLLIEDLSTANSSYDAEPTLYGYSADKPAIIAWATTTTVRIGYLHPSGVLGGPLNGLPSVGTFPAVATGPVAIAWWLANPTPAAPRACLFWATSDNRVAYWFVNGTNLADISGNFGTAIAVGNQVQRIAAAFDVSGVVWCAGEQSGAGDATTNTTKIASVTVGAVVTSGGTIRGHGLVSRAFLDNGNVYAAVVHPAFYFPYVAVVRLSAAAGAASPTPARLLPIESPGLPVQRHLSSVSALNLGATSYASRQHAIPLLYRIQLAADSSQAVSNNFGEVGIELFSLDFDNAAAWQTAPLGRGLYLGGACMQHYDGRRWAEADFHCAPDTASGTISAVVNGLSVGGVDVGVHNYRLVYEEIDDQGELHRGAVSVPIAVTFAAPHTVTIAIPPYRLTNKKHVRIGVFRTVANQTGSPDQIPYYRVSSLDVNTVGTTNGYVPNDVTVDSVSFTDGMSDATLLTQEPLYTNGGILSNIPASFGGGVLAVGKNRLFWADPTDPNLIRYSQELADDCAVEMPTPLSLRVDPYGGRIVGIGVMDDAVIVFKETAVYAFVGPGPLANPNAGQDAFSPAGLLTSDVGCNAPRSVAQTPVGIVFQSSKGIKLLGRDRQVVDIGSSVYSFNAQTYVRATLLPDRTQIVFLTSSGSTLLYDYDRQQWSRYTNHTGLDAVVWNGTYCYLRSDGRVFVETPGVYKDDNSHIPMVIETAWVKLTGYLQGWQRILSATLLGAWKSSHSLRARYRIDYEDSYTTFPDIPVDNARSVSAYGAGTYGTGAYGGTAKNYGAVYQETLDINQRCQAISFRFEDVEATTAFGAAFELSELLLIGGVLGQRFPVGASRQN